MAFPKFASSLYPLLAFAFLIQSAYAIDPLFNFCSTNKNFTGGSPYAANLNNLLSYLSYKAPSDGLGFGTGTFGFIPDRAYGLALCRGDVKEADCETCLAEAATRIRQLCPSEKAAIVAYDNCMLKYSDKYFFGQIDKQNKFHMWNWNDVADPKSFNQKTNRLLSQLVKKARVSSTPKLYATGEMELGGSNKKLYGMVQCTRDLSSANCEKCLNGIIAELPSCCDGKEGGRVITGSCNFRYEMYTFVNE